MITHLLIAAAWAVAGACLGWVVRWGSVRLAVLEELEPGHRPWMVWGPPILSALLFAGFAYELGAVPLLLLQSFFILVLVQVIFFDYEHRLILDRVMFPSMAVALIASLFRQHWWSGLLAAFAAGGLFFALSAVGAAVFKAEALGFGDVKLAFFMGLLLGPTRTIQALFYGVFLAGLVSVGFIVWHRSLRGTIAYGPYLAAGTLIVLFQLH